MSTLGKIAGLGVTVVAGAVDTLVGKLQKPLNRSISSVDRTLTQVLGLNPNPRSVFRQGKNLARRGNDEIFAALQKLTRIPAADGTSTGREGLSALIPASLKNHPHLAQAFAVASQGISMLLEKLVASTEKMPFQTIPSELHSEKKIDVNAEVDSRWKHIFHAKNVNLKKSSQAAEAHLEKATNYLQRLNSEEKNYNNILMARQEISLYQKELKSFESQMFELWQEENASAKVKKAGMEKIPKFFSPLKQNCIKMNQKIDSVRDKLLKQMLDVNNDCSEEELLQAFEKAGSAAHQNSLYGSPDDYGQEETFKAIKQLWDDRQERLNSIKSDKQ